MMPITTISLVTANQLSCRLAAAGDHARPQCASSAPRDDSFVCRAQSTTPVSAIICPFGPSRRRHRRPLHCWLPPNPHSAR